MSTYRRLAASMGRPVVLLFLLLSLNHAELQHSERSKKLRAWRTAQEQHVRGGDEEFPLELDGFDPSKKQLGDRSEHLRAWRTALQQDLPRVGEDDSERDPADFLGGFDVLPVSMQTFISPDVSARLRGRQIAQKCRFRQVCSIPINLGPSWARCLLVSKP